MAYIIPSLHSIKELVKTLREDALEICCRDGCLLKDHIHEVESMKFSVVHQGCTIDDNGS